MDRRQFALGGAFATLLWSTKAAAQHQGARHPSATLAMELVSRARWSELSSLVSSLPPQSARVLIGDLGDLAPLGLDFGDLAERPMGHTTMAGIQVAWAWRSRGRGVASTVTAQGLEGFVEHLTAARSNVEQAIAADVQDGAAHALGFTVNMGLGDKPALYDGLHGYLISARRPVGGLGAFANAISRKWLGSEPETLEFARQAYRLDLPASAGLIPDVHYVCWGSRLMARPQTTPPFEVYLSDPTVDGEILDASDAFNSVGPDPDPFANAYAHSHLAFALLALNQVERARPHLLGMGPYIRGPWADMPDARRAIDALRRRVGVEEL
jgi:hypothetical protein